MVSFALPKASQDATVISDEVLAQLPLPPVLLQVVAAGRTFYKPKAQDNVTTPQSPAEEDEDKEMAKKFKQKKKKIVLDENEEDRDLYELLGLEDLRWRATADQLRKAYRNKVLEYHPDKNMENVEEAVKESSKPDDTVFKAIQAAWDVLGDEKKRRAYDSKEDFDDNLPSVSGVNDQTFFTIFANAFDKWSKWSSLQVNVKIGDDNTPYAEVERFYRFWTNQFKSWRDFAFEDEYDLQQAESREERKWMLRQNEKQQQKSKAEERSQVLKLVDLSKKHDPRIRRKRKEEEDAKKQKEEKAQKEKLQKQMEKQRQEEEKLQKELDEKKRIEDEEKRKQEDIAKEAELLEQAKLQLRQNCAPFKVSSDYSSKKKQAPKGISGEEIEYLILRLNRTDLTDLNSKLEQAAPSGVDAICVEFDAKVAQVKSEEEERKKQMQAKEQKKEKLQAQVKDWTNAELALLAKAIATYPGGVQQRWKRIAEYVKTRTEEEVETKINEIRKAGNRKESYVPNRNQDEYFGEFMENKNKNQTAIKKDEDQKDQVLKQAAQKPAPKPAATTTTTTKPTTPQPAKPASPVAVAADKKKPEENWSAEQQKALEKGLKEVKPTDADRWEKIAKGVPGGKTKDECLARFNYCKQLALDKKKAAEKK